MKSLLVFSGGLGPASCYTKDTVVVLSTVENIAVRPELNSPAALNVLWILCNITCEKGHVVAQLVGALRHKPEGREFNPYSVTGNFNWNNRPHSGPGLDQTLTEMSTRNVDRRVKAAGHMADNPTAFTYQLSVTSWNPEGLSGLVQGLLHLYLLYVKM
jgi:hypothetical protein